MRHLRLPCDVAITGAGGGGGGATGTGRVGGAGAELVVMFTVQAGVSFSTTTGNGGGGTASQGGDLVARQLPSTPLSVPRFSSLLAVVVVARRYQLLQRPKALAVRQASRAQISLGQLVAQTPHQERQV